MSERIQIAFALVVSLSFILALMVLTYAVLPFAAVLIPIVKLAEGGGVDPHSHP